MRLVLTLALLSVFSSAALADTVFHCRMNATANRDFKYIGTPLWCGPVDDCGPRASFDIKLFAKPSFDELYYREFLISLGRDPGTVRVKSFWAKGDDGKPLSEEFDAHVVSRTERVVFFVYINPTGNKVHSYALHLGHKKLVAADVADGLTGLVTQARTFDCE